MKLTRREREVLETVRKCVDIKTASSRLGIEESTIYNILYRIRKKYETARSFVNTILNYRRDDRIDKLLAVKRTRKEEEELE